MVMSLPVFLRSVAFSAVFLLCGALSGHCGEPDRVGQTQDGADWVHMSAGVKPVFPGIHGGTAPVSLVPLADGRFFALTGKTGQDFICLIRGNTADEAAIQAPVAMQSTSPSVAAQEVVLADGNTLSLFSSPTTEASSWSTRYMATTKQAATVSAQPQLPANRKPAFSPLRLRPYPVLTNLSRDGV